MFNFQAPGARALILDPSSGNVPGGGAVTKAIANPKNLTTKSLQVQLDGTTSTSSDGGPLLSYQWTVNSGSLQAEIASANSNGTATVALVSGPGTYSFTLTVTDSAGKAASDTVTIVKQ